MSRQGTRGFTLIELMLAVAILAILAAIAIPNYQDYLVRSRRAAAEAAMQDVAGLQERYRLDNRAYATTLVELGYVVPPEVDVHYDLAIVVAAPGYSITGTPTGGQLSLDAQCGTLTLTSTGGKSASGGGAQCWR